MSCRGCEDRRKQINAMIDRAKESWEKLIGKESGKAAGTEQSTVKAKPKLTKADREANRDQSNPEQTDIVSTGTPDE